MPITDYSTTEQTPGLTDGPHMAPRIGTCFLDHPAAYIYSSGVAVDSVRGGGRSTERCVFPCSPVIQTAHPPFNSLQVLHQPVSHGRICWTGPPETDRGSVLEPFPPTLRWPVCVFPVRVSRNQIHPFQGVWEGGGDERRAEEGRKTKNYLCPSAIT